MTNWANTHKMTGVGSALKRHYQGLLLDYEMANPQDVYNQASMQQSKHLLHLQCARKALLASQLSVLCLLSQK